MSAPRPDHPQGHGGHGHVVVKLNGRTHGFTEAHHSLAPEEVVQLRKFLATAGADPERDVPL